MDFLCSLAWLLIFIVMFPLCESKNSEVVCLRSVKESLKDPFNKLSTWQFNNRNIRNDDYICSFNGVSCSNSLGENWILSINLTGMGLIGKFPHGIRSCSSLVKLDLSNNHLHGSIPSHISKTLSYLDLSSNKFSGKIPKGIIADCPYIKVLKLNNNFLTGRIPQQLVTLSGLTTFTVANNSLSGPVPAFKFAIFGPENYANNRGLCGYPLDPCESGESEKDLFISGLIVGWAIFFALFFVVGYWIIPLDRFFIIKFIDKIAFKFIRRERITNPRLRLLSSTWTNRICSTMVSELEKFATRMSFSELSEATDSFNENNIIATGETGITYNGTIRKGCCVAIRNLFNFPNLQHQFQSEIKLLSKFRHTNLVPLIGFCHESNGSFIVYKFMANGSLHDCLFSVKIMEWAVRVRIAVGVAKGIAWLHQNRVIHGWISAKCVLLDENFDPNISDFGKVTTRGCYEEDVYGFGIVLLELITRKRHEEFINSFEGIGGNDLFEKKYELPATGAYVDEMYRLLVIARKCVQSDSGNWPSMVEVYQMLMGKSPDDRDTKNEMQFVNWHRISRFGMCFPCRGRS